VRLGLESAEGVDQRDAGECAMSLAPPSLKLEIVEIGQLPFFNRDMETGSSPAQWTGFPPARQGR
jgi:hypothetical protein